ncbi:MAG: AMP-binding protein [Proteobacteria bacterium]|nr:AMP-binding protein [Pseudomonadota bacterium]
MMVPNTLVFPVGMFGVIRAGGVQVNVNPLYSPRELEHQLQDADTDTIVIFSGSTETLAQVIDQIPVKNVIVFDLDNLVNKGLPSPPVDDRMTDTLDFMDALSQGANLDLLEPELTREDLTIKTLNTILPAPDLKQKSGTGPVRMQQPSNAICVCPEWLFEWLNNIRINITNRL